MGGRPCPWMARRPTAPKIALTYCPSRMKYSMLWPYESHFNMVKPSVNIQKTMERSTMFNGKIHDFYGHGQ